MLIDVLLVSIIYGFFSGVVAFFISPLQYLKIIRQETGQTYKEILKRTLHQRSPIRTLFRGSIPYTLMNFLSNLSFGISDYISNIFLINGDNNGDNFLVSIFVRAILGGAIETVCTIYPEIKEIVKNKGNLAQNNGKLLMVVFPLALRNTIAWFGAILTYEISIRTAIPISALMLISFSFGIIFGIISIPMDVIATQNCGSNEKLSSFHRAVMIFKQSKSNLLYGSVIRIIQISIFTAVTFLTMLFVRSLGY